MVEIIEGRRQESWCGVASLQYALGVLGLAVDQNAIALLARTTYEEGTSGENMKQTAEVLGFKANWVQGIPLEMLEHLREKEDCQIVLNWWCDNSDDGGHYSCLYKLDKDVIWLQDPELEGCIKILRRTDFEKRWWDMDGDVKLEKWALVISKK